MLSSMGRPRSARRLVDGDKQAIAELRKLTPQEKVERFLSIYELGRELRRAGQRLHGKLPQ